MNPKIQKIMEIINQLSSDELAELKMIINRLWHLPAKNTRRSLQHFKAGSFTRILTSHRKSNPSMLSKVRIQIIKRSKNKSSTTNPKNQRPAGNPTTPTARPAPKSQPKPTPKPVKKIK